MAKLGCSLPNSLKGNREQATGNGEYPIYTQLQLILVDRKDLEDKGDQGGQGGKKVLPMNATWYKLL
ncbi:MAG TPA: hypothetical protein DEG47_22615 [Cyanobacteria bacterium UBA11148]|nr:hypothetical protein [Cyanobacteria bacterium UBA11148]